MLKLWVTALCDSHSLESVTGGNSPAIATVLTSACDRKSEQ